MSTEENKHTVKYLSDKLRISSQRNEVRSRIVAIHKQLKKRNIRQSMNMLAVGWTYDSVSDTAHCETCGLQVSGWTEEMNPLAIHTGRSPTCPFVQSKNSINLLLSSSSPHHHTRTTIENQEKSIKRRKTDSYAKPLLVEVESLKKTRRRTFSHWSNEQTPSVAQMILAGFFSCNVGDRVICLYCNLICQQWTLDADDPHDVHRLLSPQCPYVLQMFKTSQTAAMPILNENSTSNTHSQLRMSNIPGCNEIVHMSACHVDYMEIPKRQASFSSWPQGPLPSVDDMVRAGFFYTGVKTIVTCFYCNGSLQNWGSNDNPTVEHCRWFPNCAYVKQLCGDKIYRKVQESKRIYQERAKAKQSAKNGQNHSSNSSQLLISDENTLSRLVAARLDLPISQSLLNRNFKLSIIKRCWEDQLRLKQDDFLSDCDLFIACIILQKQIDHIKGKKENIIIPSVTMKLIREKGQIQNIPSDQSVLIVEDLLSQNLTSTQKIETIIPSNTKETKTEIKTNPESDTGSSNLCVLCLTEEKRLACIPCGHLTTCVPCGRSLRICPMCRRDIEAFVRIYI